jgi:O-antigen/teichoic acid export membrane protein
MSITNAIKRALPKNSFVRSVLVLGGGTAGSQAILILSAPLLTRLYSTEAFGVLAVFMAFLSTISVVSSLRYELAIPIAEDEEEAVHVVVLAFLVALTISALTLLIVALFRNPIASAVNVPALANYLWLLPVSLLLLSTYQIFNYWAIRVKAFRAIARTKLTQAVSSMAIQIGGAAFGSLALIVGNVAGQGVGMTSLGALAIKSRWHMFRHTEVKDICWTAKRHSKFPFFATWGGLLNVVGAQLPPILFAVFFSPAIAGLYALANRVLSLPMTLVGKAIGNVFLSKASSARRDGNIEVLVSQVHENLAKIAMPPTLLLAILGPDLFAWFFGPEWREAGVFARLMAPMLYFQFIFSPISTLSHVMNKQEQNMIFQGIMLIGRCSSLFIGEWFNSIRLAVILFSFSSAISYLFFLIWLMQISGNYWPELIKVSGRILGKNLILICPILIAKLLNTNTIIIILSFALTTLLIVTQYCLYLKQTWAKS